MTRASLEPTLPRVIDIDLTTLREKDFRELFCDEKLRWSIAKQIRDLRLQRGWSQADMASRLGCTQARVSSIEDPKGSWPTVKLLRRVANVFDVALTVQFVTHGEFLRHIAALESGCLWIPPFDLEGFLVS